MSKSTPYAWPLQRSHPHSPPWSHPSLPHSPTIGPPKQMQWNSCIKDYATHQLYLSLMPSVLASSREPRISLPKQPRNTLYQIPLYQKVTWSDPAKASGALPPSQHYWLLHLPFLVCPMPQAFIRTSCWALSLPMRMTDQDGPSSATLAMNKLQKSSVLALLPTRTQVLCIMTVQGISLHVAWWQHMFFCDVSLWNKHHLCKPIAGLDSRSVLEAYKTKFEFLAVGYCSGYYEARSASGRASGKKYKAQIVIFCILLAVNRFPWISWKAKSCWGKLESRWGNLESRWRKSESRWRFWDPFPLCDW